MRTLITPKITTSLAFKPLKALPATSLTKTTILIPDIAPPPKEVISDTSLSFSNCLKSIEELTMNSTIPQQTPFNPQNASDYNGGLITIQKAYHVQNALFAFPAQLKPLNIQLFSNNEDFQSPRGDTAINENTSGRKSMFSEGTNNHQNIGFIKPSAFS